MEWDGWAHNTIRFADVRYNIASATAQAFFPELMNTGQDPWAAVPWQWAVEIGAPVLFQAEPEPDPGTPVPIGTEPAPPGTVVVVAEPEPISDPVYQEWVDSQNGGFWDDFWNEPGGLFPAPSDIISGVGSFVDDPVGTTVGAAGDVTAKVVEVLIPALVPLFVVQSMFNERR